MRNVDKMSCPIKTRKNKKMFLNINSVMLLKTQKKKSASQVVMVEHQKNFYMLC